MSNTEYTRENPSPRFRTLEGIYRQVHGSGLPAEDIAAEDLFAGRSLQDHLPSVKSLVEATGACTILDYGSGKGVLYAKRDLMVPGGARVHSIRDYWGVDEIRCFDPGVPEFAMLPSAPADGVICTDVLEHIPEEDVPWLLAELFRLSRRFVFANIASYPAGKTLPNGWNAHVTIRPSEWWAERIRKAAEGWGGDAYEFQVRRRRRGLARVFRRILHLKKWTTTSIAESRSVPDRAATARQVAQARS
jgi:hypothetical protein